MQARACTMFAHLAVCGVRLRLGDCIGYKRDLLTQFTSQ